jgi:hypothetical protein
MVTEAEERIVAVARLAEKEEIDDSDSDDEEIAEPETGEGEDQE